MELGFRKLPSYLIIMLITDIAHHESNLSLNVIITPMAKPTSSKLFRNTYRVKNGTLER